MTIEQGARDALLQIADTWGEWVNWEKEEQSSDQSP